MKYKQTIAMKKFFIAALAFVCGTSAALANDYAFLTFETTEGEKFSVAIPPVDITLSGNSLTVGEQHFEVSNLSSMYFTTGNESTVTGIQSTTTNGTTKDIITAVYDLQGRVVNPTEMKKGQVYLVQTNHKNFKIAVQWKKFTLYSVL